MGVLSTQLQHCSVCIGEFHSGEVRLAFRKYMAPGYFACEWLAISAPVLPKIIVNLLPGGGLFSARDSASYENAME